jgi:phospholipid/cholesterol/gamma-HCH transport system substrate-binding protein
MANETSKNIRLGFFMTIGTIAIIAALYLVGSKQNLFGSTIRIYAEFHNVNGLMSGNNVRFAGIDVGTVESVEIISDTSVRVMMNIETRTQEFILKNAIASVGTDGLMGNKLVNINSVKGTAKCVEEGDILQSQRPIEMDEMVRTLSVTNDNIKVISGNLRTISEKINSSNTLWSLLMDTVVAENVKSSLVNLKVMSNNAVLVTGDLSSISRDIRKGKGTIGALITDTTISGNIRQVVVKLEKVSDTAAILSGELSQIVKNIKAGKGTAGVLLNDTTMVHRLNKALSSIDTAASGFSTNMEALHYSWPFKKYFKKKSKTTKNK